MNPIFHNEVLNETRNRYISNFNINTGQMVGVQWQLYKNLNNRQNISIIIEDNYIEHSHNDFDTYVLNPWTWTDSDSYNPVYVFVVPPLAVLVCVINAIACYVFYKERMLSSNNILLIGIAVSDALYILTPSPFLVYAYATPGAYIPLHLCRIWDYATKTIPTIMHTSSIWLTTCLGIHRYICVCHPLKIKRYFNRKRSVILICVTYIGATCFHFCRLIDTRYIALRVEVTDVNISTCQGIHDQWLSGHEVIYECIYYWMYITFIVTLPCIAMIVLNILIIKKLRQSERMSCAFVSVSNTEQIIIKSEVSRQRHRRSNRMTKVIVGIISIVIAVELPIGIILVLWTLTMIHHKMYIPETTLGFFSVGITMVLYVSFPVIFLMFCMMSSKFRHAIKNIFCCLKGNSFSLQPERAHQSDTDNLGTDTNS